jgi:hypothetical protein
MLQLEMLKLIELHDAAFNNTIDHCFLHLVAQVQMQYNETEAVTKATITVPIMKESFSPIIINAPKVRRNSPSA